MSAGRLRERVRFERRLPADDSLGNTEGDWAAILSPFFAAEIRPLRGDEEVLAARLQGVALVEIRIYSTDETRQLQVSDRCHDLRNGTVYNIRSIENRDLRNEFLTITAQRGVAHG